MEYLLNVNIKMEQNIDKTFIITQKIKRPKSSKGLSKIEALYEEVIQKNFQIIDELLKRLSRVITRHDEFETQFQQVSKRLSKFENDLETIHNEHRRDNLHIVSNINGIRTEIVGIDTQFKMLFDKVQHKGFSNFLQNKCRFRRKQSLEIGSILSSTHKMSENSSLLNFDPGDEESQPLKQAENDPIGESQKLLKLEGLPLLIKSFDKLKNSNQSKKQDQKSQGNSNVSIQSEPEATPPNLRDIFTPRSANQTKKTSVFLAQKKEEDSIMYYLQKLTDLLNESKQNEEDAKAQIVASFARHRTKITSIFKQFKQKNLDPHQAKASFYNAIDQILSQDQILNAKVSQTRVPRKISQQISEILYQNYYEKVAIQEQTKLIAGEIVGKEMLDINVKLSGLEKKYEKVSEFQEKWELRLKQFSKQIEISKERHQQCISQDQLADQIFRIIEMSHKKWEDFYLNCANKEQTAKAISFLSSKMDRLIYNIKQEPQLGRGTCTNIQTKCLCCASSVSKSPTPRKTATSTARPSITQAQAQTLRMRPNQLKKKTLEMLKNNRTQLSNSVYNS